MSLRTLLLGFGVLVLQVGFVLSFVGAFHHPEPHHISVAVVAPPQVSGELVTDLNSISGEPLLVTTATDEQSARAALLDGSISAVLVVDTTSNVDSLLVAAAGGRSTANAVEQVLNSAEASQNRTAQVSDLVPVQDGDAGGLTGFYLVVGWTIGGYLVAALLGIATGPRPASMRLAAVRLVSVLPYAVISGLAGAIVVGPVLGALTGHLLALWGIGALVVFAAAAVTVAFQVLFGVLGIGLTILLFVVLGNPSAGGGVSADLLPPFWRAIGGAIPNGAGTEAIRRVTYFGAHNIASNLLVIAIYAVAGVAIAMIVSGWAARRTRPGRS
ncbi:MAG: DUF3533 domain-containing protein [Geodermatophilaceae bacterium]